MLRWLKTILAVACWSFLLVGGIGLVEGISQWFRFDVVGGQPQPLNLVRLWVPYLVLYGWFGLICGTIVLLPASFLARLRAQPRRLGFTWAVAGAVASLMVVYAGYLGRVHLLPDMWEQEGVLWVNILLGLVWLVSVIIFSFPLWRLADWMARQRTRTLVFPAVVMIVATGLWPNWREEGRNARTAHLNRAAAPAAARPGAPNLVLVSIDTWRRDHLSLINGEAPPTPSLNALADQSVLFTNAWSVSPWTLPSMATLMTGLPPRALRVRKWVPLPSDINTLAELAWQQGYQTAAFATNPYLTSWYGFDRGFEVFMHSQVIETLLPAERSVLAREVNDLANRSYEPNNTDKVIATANQWLHKRGEGPPLFLWIHLMNPHLPYCWRDMPLAAERLQVNVGREPDLSLVPENDWFKDHKYKGVMKIRRGEFVPNEAEKEALRTLYAREVQFTDYFVGQLFQKLKQIGLWDDTVVVVLSDHGEEFWEHDGFEHGHSVMPEVCGVPLLIRLPRDQLANSVITAPVTTLDIAPTLCDLLSWPAFTYQAGQTWLPLADLQTRVLENHAVRPYILENLLYEPQQQGLVAWPWLSVRTEGENQSLWYDLSSDETASQPLHPPATAGFILALADSIQAEWDRLAEIVAVSEESPGTLPEDLQRSLRSLGY